MFNFDLGICLYNSDRFVEAIIVFDELIKLKPEKSKFYDLKDDKNYYNIGSSLFNL